MRASCREMFLELLAGQRVLEIGCGPGHDGAKFQEVGCEVTAIDLCESFLEYGRQTYPKVVFKCMNLQEPDFPQHAFDGVFGMACFCHVPRENVQDVLRKYYEILEPGGCIFFSHGDSEQVDGYVVEDWGGVDGNAEEMVCYHRDALKRELEEAGFQETCITPIACPHYEEMPRLKKIGIRMYAISARKQSA